MRSANIRSTAFPGEGLGMRFLPAENGGPSVSRPRIGMAVIRFEIAGLPADCAGRAKHDAVEPSRIAAA